MKQLGVELAYVARAELLTRVAEKIARKDPTHPLVGTISVLLSHAHEFSKRSAVRITDDGEEIVLWILTPDGTYVKQADVICDSIARVLGQKWREQLNDETR